MNGVIMQSPHPTYTLEIPYNDAWNNFLQSPGNVVDITNILTTEQKNLLSDICSAYVSGHHPELIIRFHYGQLKYWASRVHFFHGVDVSEGGVDYVSPTLVTDFIYRGDTSLATFNCQFFIYPNMSGTSWKIMNPALNVTWK